MVEGRKTMEPLPLLMLFLSPLPMLFLMAMEPLHLLFKKAKDDDPLSHLSVLCDACRVSLYEDDAILFIKASRNDLQVTDYILEIFAQACGLCTNLAKTHFSY
jgi:hypothetical protein